MNNARALTFGDAYELPLVGNEEWFNPCIILDSPLCIDPFLVLDLEHDDEFKGAHGEIVDFFQDHFQRVAEAGTNIHSRVIQQVVDTLLLPEAQALCLGYSGGGTKGSGSGRVLAELMVRAMMMSIAGGLTRLRHFEEISILGSGIGPDRISDASGSIIKWRLAEYTTRICKSLGIPLQRFTLDRARYDRAQRRWVSIEAHLPSNPRTGRELLLVPKRFLRHLPTLGSDEFELYALQRWQNDHKEQLDKKIVTVDRDKILTAARMDARVRMEFVTLAEESGGTPYDFSRDHSGVLGPAAASKYIAAHPFAFTTPANAADMRQFVLSLANYFKHFIEEQKGWELLWDKSRPKPESAVQRLFLAVAFLICAHNDIAVDKETNIGRGPVDFKFSKGFRTKCLVETKLARNRKWIDGAIKQLPTYVVADIGQHGIYIIIEYGESSNRNVADLRSAVASMSAPGPTIDIVVVDASRDKPSASKL